MKSKKDVNVSKKNGVTFLPPSGLRTTVRKRKSSFLKFSTNSASIPSPIADGTEIHREREAVVGISPRLCPDKENFVSGPPPFIEPTADLPPIVATGLVDEKLMEEDYAEPEVVKNKKVRGPNMCKVVGRLRPGQKLPIEFLDDRGAGVNQRYWSRHIGRLVRDNSICPVRVRGWEDMGNEVENHLWAAITEKFSNPDMEAQRIHIIKHGIYLWTNYRCGLNRKYIKPCSSMEDAIKNVANRMDKDDWEWLVKEHFWTDEFKEISVRNAENRSQASMPCHLGSMPIRELKYQMRDEEGNLPDLATVFFHSRKRGETLGAKEAEKQVEIIRVAQENPGIGPLEHVEKSFGPQKRHHVICYGGGVTPKQLRGPKYKKNADLEARLQRVEEENEALAAEKATLEAEKAALQAEKETVQADNQALQHRVETMDADFRAEFENLRTLIQLQQSTNPSGLPRGGPFHRSI